MSLGLGVCSRSSLAAALPGTMPAKATESMTASNSAVAGLISLYIFIVVTATTIELRA